ncbi:MAG: ClbS/DfsB family four-helix bundle protein [Candidatus Thorarchaeota archaeon]
MNTPSTKNELVELIKTARDRWKTQLERVDRGKMELAGVTGDWSVKDLVAHITWSENEMVGLLGKRVLVGSELWSLSTDERNHAVYLQNKDRPLDEVLNEAEALYTQLLKLVEGLDDEELHDPSRFENMPSDWTPWRIIAGNTYIHYDEHAQDLKAWLKENS